MWKKISFVFFLGLFVGISLYAIWIARRIEAERMNSAQLSKQIEAERKAMFLRDAGLSFTDKNDFYQIVRGVRDRLYQNNFTVKQQEDFNGEYDDVYLKYNLIFGNRHAFNCGLLAQVYKWVLDSLNVPSRFVQLATSSFVNGEHYQSTHVYVEIFNGKKWFVSDPRFNAEFYCSDGAGPLSTKEIKGCFEKNIKIVPAYGKTILPNNTVETYPIPFEDLLYAYTLKATTIGDKVIPIEEHPFPGWIETSIDKYQKR